MKNGELTRRLRSWIEDGIPQGPYSLHISPTMACDLDCLFCRRKSRLPRPLPNGGEGKGEQLYKSNPEIPDHRYIQIVKEALDMGVKVIVIKGGGEPLLRKNLMSELIPLIKSHGAYGNLVTNGTHLDEELSDAFVSSGWDQITISLDGPSAAIHDYLRDSPGTFDRIISSVKRLNHIKKDLRSRLPLLGFHCVLTGRNYDSLDALIKLARENQVRLLELDSMSLRNEEARPLLLDDAAMLKLQKLMPSCLTLLERYGISHNFEKFCKPEYVRRDENRGKRACGALRTDISCYYPWYQASIVPSGSIVPCCYAEETHSSAANLNDVSFREAWFQRDPQEYRNQIRSGAMMPFCRDCTAMYMDNNLEIRNWLETDYAER